MIRVHRCKCTVAAHPKTELPGGDVLETMRSRVLTLVLCLLVSAGVSVAATIGPDSAGYTATDSVSFAFTDISGSGTRILAGVDDVANVVALGFTFNFYGTNYTTVCISSNGLLSFGTCSTTFTNRTLNGPLVVNAPTIAVLWDDWWFGSSSVADAVYFQTTGSAGSRRFIVQWNRALPCCETGPTGDQVTFQAILFETSNTIQMQYQDTTTPATLEKINGASATVGIRDTNGDANGRRLQWSFNSAVIPDGKAIEFDFPAGGIISLGTHVTPGRYGHHIAHGAHHGEHGHTEPGNGNPPHIPGHAAGLTAEEGGVLPPEPALLAGRNEDGTVNANLFMNGQSGLAGARPARRGTIVQLFGTASGIELQDENGTPVDGDPALLLAPATGGLYRTRMLPRVQIGGMPAEVLFSGLAPGLQGVWQINVRIPEGVSSSDGQVIVVVSYGEGVGLKTLVGVE